jgi:hypothetical protein
VLVHFQEKTMYQPTRLVPLFHPGKLLVSHAALAALRTNGVPVISIVLRHIAGDWGIVSDDDRRHNDLSIAAGLRLLSIYRLPVGGRLIVTTEWNRSHTTVDLFGQVILGREAHQAPATGCTRYPAWPNANYAQGDQA